MEAVTLDLSEVRGLALDHDLVIAADLQSLLRRLEAGWSPPSGGT